MLPVHETKVPPLKLLCGSPQGYPASESEAFRTISQGNSVTRAAKAQSACPDSRIAARFFLSFRA
jgi:hypothetical protein